MGELSDLPETASAHERAQAYRKRAIELLDISNSLQNENGRRILRQTAQEFYRLAEALERPPRPKSAT